MSHGGEKSPQAKTLSAEVEPFVPSHVPPGHSKDPLAAGDSLRTAPTTHQQDSTALPPTGMHNSSPQKDPSAYQDLGVDEYPRYMTNCYPFVQDNSGVTDVRWQQGGLAGALAQPYQSYPSHPEFYPAPPPQPVYPGYYPGYTVNPYTGGYQPHHLPPPYPSYNIHKQGGRQGKQAGNRQSKNNRRRNRSQGGDSKSVGVQKTASGEKVIIPSKDIKKKTKTVIFVDASQQTDFPDDLASQSLAERPSTFRKTKAKNRRKTQSQQTRRPDVSSTDSEVDTAQVDSDSGYSSPKHCRNLSAGSTQGIVTQDAATGTGASTSKPSNVNAAEQSESQSQATMSTSVAAQPMSYAGAVAKAPQPTAAPTPSGSNRMQNERTSAANQGTPRNKSKGNVQRNRNTPTDDADESTIRSDVISPTDTLNSSVSSTTVLETQTKKKKPRKRNKSKDSGKSANSSNNSVVPAEYATTAPQSAEELGVLRFEDDSEYPDLPSSSGSQSLGGGSGTAPMNYSAVVQHQNTSVMMSFTPLSQEPVQHDIRILDDSTTILPEELMSPEAAVSGVKEGKNAKKRRKKALLATQAAAQEYSEITFEQRQLQENMKKPSKRTKMPIQFDLGDMLAALEKQQKQEQKSKQTNKEVKLVPPSIVTGIVPAVATAPPVAAIVTTSIDPKPKKKELFGANPLDSSAPLKRGKEREVAAKKKPSALKRVILREREEKKRKRILGECALSDDDSSKVLSQSNEEVIEEDDEEDTVMAQLSQDGISDKGSSVSLSQSQSELSPVSQMSPMSMSPLSPGSPLSSGLPSPVVGLRTPSPSSAIPYIHSRRFREYCNQVLDKDIDACCTTLLQTLCRFQDRQYHKDPSKAKSKRRLVMGLREVTKHLRLKKIKCIVISPNLERIQSRGGLDDVLDVIIGLATDQGVPFVFALGRKALGRAVNKLVPVSVVGVFNYDGAEDVFRELLNLSAKARESYRDMVTKYQQELESQNVARISKHRQHMGHNRNLSNCSGISFSSVISEPISENYPDPEPELDEHGREIETSDQTNIDAALAQTLHLSSVDVGKTVMTDVLNSFEESEIRTEMDASNTTLKAMGEDEEDEEESDDEELDDDEICEEDEEEEDEEEDDGEKVCDSSYKTVDKERIVSWVAEAQSCISSLEIADIEDDTKVSDTKTKSKLEAVQNDDKNVIGNGCHDNQMTSSTTTTTSQADINLSKCKSLSS
ncbi:selenocysteine insertion sequence-binding protein 2-like isoform X2 [Glandiceps talaboti]